jgi:hypothetical protein
MHRQPVTTRDNPCFGKGCLLRLPKPRIRQMTHFAKEREPERC